MSSDAPVTFLTQDAYDRLASELEQLSTTGLVNACWVT